MASDKPTALDKKAPLNAPFFTGSSDARMKKDTQQLGESAEQPVEAPNPVQYRFIDGHAGLRHRGLRRTDQIPGGG